MTYRNNYNPVKRRAQQAAWPLELIIWIAKALYGLFKPKAKKQKP